jgi:hypothetical protein
VKLEHKSPPETHPGLSEQPSIPDTVEDEEASFEALFVLPERRQQEERAARARSGKTATPSLAPKQPKPPEPKKHRWFDGWLRGKEDGGLRRLVENTTRFLDHHEEHTQTRKRGGRATDLSAHRLRVEAIVCNLAYAVLEPPPTGKIATKLGNGNTGRTRYDSEVLGNMMRPTVQMLEAVNILAIHHAEAIRGEVSSIIPTARFREKVQEFGITKDDFTRDAAEEVLILRRSVKKDTHWASGSAPRKTREPINYTETEETRKVRDGMRHQNGFLGGADITFLDDGLEPRVDPFERTSKRYFVILEGQPEGFDQGGRLYGGFWQNLKSDRRQHIRIGGEPVAVLDYGSMFTRLAYFEVGAVPPECDLYAIPGAEGYRSGIKLAMNCFLFDGGNRSKWPTKLRVGVGSDEDAKIDPSGEAASYEARLPRGWTVGKTKKAILAVHPALKPAWGRRLGYGLMYKESQILIAVLEALRTRNIPALGLHDGLLVGQSRAEEAEAVMIKKAVEVGGGYIPVNTMRL